jgi:hypothetical protein
LKREKKCASLKGKKNVSISSKGGFMSNIASSVVEIQTSPESVPSTPSWLGEVVVVAHYLSTLGVLEKIALEVRFARGRLGIYDVIDFVAVLIGYALSGERTLETFYARLYPFATPLMALFGRNKLPSRSALSRFLEAIDQPTVEALRARFEEDLQARPLSQQDEHNAGLRDRCGEVWKVFDADGTRQAARQRALPHSPDLPRAHRRIDGVCAPGYLGRKRGEVVRTRTTLLLAHTQQWFATFGNAGNGEYRGELLRVISVLTQYACKQHVPLARILLRLDGQYGDLAVVIDLLSRGLCFLTRGKDYGLLDLPVIQARLQGAPDEVSTHPETGTCRALFDCPAIPLPGTGLTMRVIVATHQASGTSAPVGVTRDGVVYELFFTALPSSAFTPEDVVNLYLHRGAFETVLGDEDQEQNPDRWVSYTPWGQEVWQVISQWMWNLRLELGHLLHPTPVRITEMAPAQPDLISQQGDGPQGTDLPHPCYLTASPLAEPAPVLYGPPEFARTPRAGKFPATAFEPQPDGTLRCPTGHPLYAEARRPEHDGTLRLLYAARLPDCRGCRLREHCLGYGNQTKGPRRVSAVLRPVEGPSPPRDGTLPLTAPTEPILWGDWSRSATRRAFIGLLHTQTVTMTMTPAASGSQDASGLVVLTRKQRAHWRFSWTERLSRNASSPLSPRVHLQLFGIPIDFAHALGLPLAA